MSCGSPLGDLFYLADTLLYRPYDSPLPLNGRGTEAYTACSSTAPSWPGRDRAGTDERSRTDERGEDLRTHLYRMYGDGQISEEVFTALQSLADRGQLRPADLAVHQALARRGGGDVAISNAMRSIQSRLTQMTQARASAGKVLVDLDARLAEIDGRMAGKEQAARENIERNEETARLRLAEKVELASSRDRLDVQAQALRSELIRLDDLRAQLETKSVELEAVQARSRLSEGVLK